MKHRSILIVMCLCCAFLMQVLIGCKSFSTQSSMTAQEQANFKGGPMPPEAVKGMQAAFARAAAKSKAEQPQSQQQGH